MAQNVEGTSEQVFSDCRAVIFVLEFDRWKELFDGGLAHVQLLRQNIPENLTVYRIRGKSETTGQIVLNVILDRDIKYEIAQGTNYHHLKTKTNVYSLKLSQESNGKEFALVVQTIIRSIQDNTPPSPREAWMPPVVRQQQAPVAQSTLIREPLVTSPDAGKNSPFYPQPFPKHNSLGTTLPTSSPSFAPTNRPAQAQRASLQHAFEGQIEMLCERLSKAISNGDSKIAVDTVKLIAEQKIQLIIKLKNHKTLTGSGDNDSFSIRVVVEDQETSGVAFEMKVSSMDTIQSLQEEVADRYGFPPKVQKWIIGNKMAKPTETLADFKIKSTGFTCFLYLVSSRNVGLTRQEFEQFKERVENRRTNTSYASMALQTAGTQSPQTSLNVGTGNQGLSRATSLPSLNTTREPGNNSVHTRQERITFRREAQITNASQPAGPATEAIPEIPVQREENIPQAASRIPVLAQRVANLPGNPDTQRTFAEAQSIEDIERLLQAMGDSGLPYQLINERIGQEESVVEPQGWTCAACTYVNPPTRPGCEVCGANRPADYVVPQNPRMTEQERLRLQKEQEEMEIFQRTIDQQQQEQEVAREMNFRQLVETAQQNLIRNTEEFDCAICFLDVEPGEGVMLRECLHCFCEDCLREHIKNCTDPEVQCPFQDNDFACHSVITAQEIKALLREEDFNKFLNRSLATAESQAANSFHCKTPNCPGWCIYEDNSNVFHCPVCQKVNCLTCKAIHHPEMNCKEYQEDLQRRAQNDVAAKQTQKFLEQMIEKGDAMKCPQCAIILLKKDGCDWMRCSMCRLEICWATRGPRWGPMGVGDLSGGCKCRVGGKKCHPNCKNCH